MQFIDYNFFMPLFSIYHFYPVLRNCSLKRIACRLMQVAFRMLLASYLLFASSLLAGCEDRLWNNPYPFDDPRANTLYFAFTEHPKHLDPAQSYSDVEWRFICQIYEPPLQYNYLKRPYVLEPQTAEEMPEVRYFDANNKPLNDDADGALVAYSEYWIRLKPGIYYQPHPAFAKDAAGNYRYLNLTANEARRYRVLSDFKETGTKELVAEDYVYQIKRLAEPKLASPIFGVMSNYIVGLSELRQQILSSSAVTASDHSREVDLRSFEFEGATAIDRYTYKIRIKGKYPQFRFWLAMPFFAPIPWEVAEFYSQPGLERHNISLDWYPVGTGPYELIENNPDRRMTLQRNPNYRETYYPSEGEPSDLNNGLLAAAGSKIPSVDKAIFTLEKEQIPYWNKFLQGYYDMSGISSDNFGTAVKFNIQGSPEISNRLATQNIRLQTSVTPELFYWGFNMLDETVGGNGKRAVAIRQAISKAFDVQYYINIFLNGRGVLANGPIPPDIFGYEVNDSSTANTIDSTSIEARVQEARKILQDAGVPEGQAIYLDAAISGDPSEIATQTWITEQFRKLGLHLIIRGTDVNRYQDKMFQGTVQFFFYGWNADYPDPENFLFLFYSANGAAKHGGMNITNYSNPEYDILYESMRVLPDGPERLQIIRKMLAILNQDVPAVWGFYPKSYALYQKWVRPGKPSGIINNTLKYSKIFPDTRATARAEWNQPIVWPLWLLGITFLISLLFFYMRSQKLAQMKRARI